MSILAHEIRNRVRGQVGNCIYQKIEYPMSFQAGIQVWPRVEEQIGALLVDRVCALVSSQGGIQIWNHMTDPK